ncbi:MAG: galactosyltransferase-related protein, partial [Dokdonella sp.]
GSRVLTSQVCAQHLLDSGRLDVSFFEPAIERRRHTLRVPLLAHLYARPHARTRGIKSCNWGFWRDDLIAINGFNEAMVGWGREDNELAARALNHGCLRRDLRFGGLGVHLWHPTRKNIVGNPNDVVLADTLARRLVRCEVGLDQHLGEFATAPVDLRTQG